MDWNKLWKEARSATSHRPKNEGDWDRKAPSFARRNSSSMYIDKCIAMLRPKPAWSVLDVGCGPGTLAIPMAKMVKKITALDFSQKMIEILIQRARKNNITNIIPLKLSWTDDWKTEGIDKHDLAIASRALSVEDLRQALEKLSSFAREKAVVTDRVQSGPFDPAAFEAVGRKLETGPDYIYTVNLLYQMGYQASVNFIRLEESLPCKDLEEALDYYAWMFHDLTGDERKRLKKYVQSITTPTGDGTFTVHREHVPTWAFISWTP